MTKTRKATVYFLATLIGSLVLLILTAAWMGDHGYVETEAYIKNIAKYVFLVTFVYGVTLCGFLAYLDRKI